MDNVKIKSISIESYSLDNTKPPNSGAITVDLGGQSVRLMLDQSQIDALVAAAQPIKADALAKVRDALTPPLRAVE